MGRCPICLDTRKGSVETNCGHTYCARCILAYWRLQGNLQSGPIKCPVCRQIVMKLTQRGTQLPLQAHVANKKTINTITQNTTTTTAHTTDANITSTTTTTNNNRIHHDIVNNCQIPNATFNHKTTINGFGLNGPTKSIANGCHNISTFNNIAETSDIDEYNRRFSNLDQRYLHENKYNTTNHGSLSHNQQTNHYYTNPNTITTNTTANATAHGHNVGFYRGLVEPRMHLCLLAAFMYLLSPVDLIPEFIFGVFGLLDDLLVLFMCFVYVIIVGCCHLLDVYVYPFKDEIRRIFFKVRTNRGRQRRQPAHNR